MTLHGYTASTVQLPFVRLLSSGLFLSSWPVASFVFRTLQRLESEERSHYPPHPCNLTTGIRAFRVTERSHALVTFMYIIGRRKLEKLTILSPARTYLGISMGDEFPP
jgi:hypothetical protein